MIEKMAEKKRQEEADIAEKAANRQRQVRADALDWLKNEFLEEIKKSVCVGQDTVRFTYSVCCGYDANAMTRRELGGEIAKLCNQLGMSALDKEQTDHDTDSYSLGPTHYFLEIRFR